MTGFPYRVCINLDRRPERRERMKREFAASRRGSSVIKLP